MADSDHRSESCKEHSKNECFDTDSDTASSDDIEGYMDEAALRFVEITIGLPL